MVDWFIKKKNNVLNNTGRELFILLVGACIYYIVSILIMDVLKAPRLTTSLILDGIIYITIGFIITIMILLVISYLTSFTWSRTYKTIRPIENGVIDKNLDGMTVDVLIERLEEFDPKSLILLQKNCIVIIAKDSIKLKEV